MTTIPDKSLIAIPICSTRRNVRVAAAFPGRLGARQPVHTVYGGAHLFKADTAQKLGELALRALDEYAPDAATLGEAIGIDAATRASASTSASSTS